MILPPPNWTSGPETPYLRERDVHVWRIRLGDEDRFDACQAVISPEERLRAARFAFAKDAERFITAHGALRFLLARYIPCDPEEITFAAGTFGKPRLLAPATDISFNLSHSGEMVLIAISRGCEVGVDVEHVSEDIQFEQIATHCFEPRDVWEVRIAPPQERVSRFFDIWTRMEARLKADGAGIGGSLHGNRWHARNLTPALGYAGAVASEGEDWQLACWEWSV